MKRSIIVCLVASSWLASNRAGAECAAGNLLTRARLVGWEAIAGHAGLLSDGRVANDGAPWDAPLAVQLSHVGSSMTWDLGSEQSLAAMLMQADANDRFVLSGSSDGVSWRELARIAEVDGVHGLRTRQLGLAGQTARFVRLGDPVGDGFYSVSELQLYCAIPTPWPPKLAVVPLARASSSRRGWSWNDESSRRWELALALGALALLGWGANLERDGRPSAYRRVRTGLLATGGVLAALTYVNFFSFHFGAFLHTWDTFHYYIGSKYFAELSYDSLYACASVADAEDPALRRQVELRRMTDLRTNVFGDTREILAHPERCKDRFTPERWAAFTRDVAYFRAKENPKRWDDMFSDHGYNATPVWNALGSALANTAPASDAQIYALAMLDPLYLLAMIVVIGWAFGWRTLSVSLLVFSTYFPCRFYWTGGSYLRWDWLFHLVAAIACLKKRRPLLGGMALGYATLLRVFPGFVFAGPLLAIVAHVVFTWRVRRGRGWWSDRRLQPYRRFLCGGLLAVVILVPVSIALSGRDAYPAFVQNTVKHKETALTNAMGLRTVLAYRPTETGRFLRDGALSDPWGAWKETRAKRWNEMKLIGLVLFVGFLAAVGLALRPSVAPEPWYAAALGVCLIPVAYGLELTSYYYAFIIAIALIHHDRPEVGRLLLALSAFSELVSFGHAYVRGMPAGFDEQHTLISFATIAVIAWILWPRWRAAPPPQSMVAVAPE